MDLTIVNLLFHHLLLLLFFFWSEIAVCPDLPTSLILDGLALEPFSVSF